MSWTSLEISANQLFLKELCSLETLIIFKIVSLALSCAEFLTGFYETCIMFY